MKLSVSSRVLDILGRTLIGRPEAPEISGGWGMGEQPEFYWRPEDRAVDVPDATEIRQRLAVNFARMAIFRRIAWVASAYAIVISIVGWLLYAALSAGIHGVGRLSHAFASPAGSTPAETQIAELKANGCDSFAQHWSSQLQSLTPEAAAAFRQTCSTSTNLPR